MINKLRGIAQERNINIVYSELPIEINSFYLEKNKRKIIMINENIGGTDTEVEEIALGLGYAKAQEELNVKVNALNKEDNLNHTIITVMAEAYKKKLMFELSLQLTNEFLEGKSEAEIKQLVNGIVDEMSNNPELYGVKRIEEKKQAV